MFFVSFFFNFKVIYFKIKMVLREHEHENFYLKIDGRWVLVDEKILRAHPGGSAMETYRNLDATTVFHTFHVNSKSAYKMLADVIHEQQNKIIGEPDIKVQKVCFHFSFLI